MTELTGRLRGVLITAIVLFSVMPLSRVMGQGRGQRGGPPKPLRGMAEVTRGAEPATPSEATPGAPGTVIPPQAGYVPKQESTAPGLAYPAPIPSDPIDRAYWELFDRNKQVKVTGKVTRVNWTNPNTYIFVQANGTEWAIESSFAQFRQAYVSPAVRPDQTITVYGYLPKDNPNPKWPVKSSPTVLSYQKAKRFIRAEEIATEYGQKLRLGKPQTEEEEAAELEKCSRLGC